MSAFAAAVTRIFADPNMAADAIWFPGRGLPAAKVRVIRQSPDDATSFGSGRVWSETERVDVMVAEVPDPRPGDRLMIDDETFEVQGEPLRDRERLVWSLDLRPL